MRKVFPFLIAVLISASLILIWLSRSPKTSSVNLDAFAQCLNEKGLIMYGADWCPHCQKEKAAFGESFQFINYVECPDNPKLCTEKGIQSYPTWITAAGQKFEGEQGLTNLSKTSGCSLPASAL